MEIKPRILYLAYGRAGLEVYEKHLKRVFPKTDIFILTYDGKENEHFLKCLKENDQSFSTESIKSENSFSKIVAFKPDFIVSMHFRDLISKKYLELVQYRAMNLHPSLLPKYAGCFATMWAIIEGECETGVTYHLMNEHFDKGNILHQAKINISNDETGETLYNKAINVAVEEFPSALKLLMDGSKGKKQAPGDHYYPRKLPYGGEINSEWSEKKIDQFIRAFNFQGQKGATILQNGLLVEITSFKDYLSLLQGKN